MRIADFALERFFARWEFAVEHLLCASDVQAMPMREVLDLADGETRAMWDGLALGYTESTGHPLLRREIAGLYDGLEADDVLVFAGAEEAIFCLANVLLGPGDHTIVERDEPTADLHLGVGAFPCDHDYVAVASVCERLLDRRAAVDDDLEAACCNLLGDRPGVLAAWVVGRDDRAVCALGGDPPHQWPLLAIAIAAGAEHDGQAPRAELACGSQHVVE